MLFFKINKACFIIILTAFVMTKAWALVDDNHCNNYLNKENENMLGRPEEEMNDSDREDEGLGTEEEYEEMEDDEGLGTEDEYEDTEDDEGFGTEEEGLGTEDEEHENSEGYTRSQIFENMNEIQWTIENTNMGLARLEYLVALLLGHPVATGNQNEDDFSEDEDDDYSSEDEDDVNRSTLMNAHLGSFHGSF